MRTKILLWSVVSILILIIGLAAGAFWWLRRPQVITFSDGAKLTLLAVDYGKRHVPPGVKLPAATTMTGPTRVRRGGAFTTPTDTLVVWVRQQHDPQQYANFQYYLYDKAGTACAVSYGYGGGGRQGNEVVGVQFSAFPRRQGKFILRVQENSNTGQEMSDQKFAIRNPAHKSYPAWTAEALPDMQVDDDLSVTLTKLVSGADMPYQRDQDDADDAANKGVQATFHIERNGNVVTNWEPVSIETSDATGNHVTGWVTQNNWQDGDDTVAYQYGLWPDEPAWKLRVEFSKQSDYNADELWTVQKIPLEPGRQMDFYNYYGRRGNTNTAFAETDLNGYHLKIFAAKQFTDVPANSQPQGGFSIETTPSLPEGMRLTLVSLTDDQTNDIGNWNFGTFGNGTSTTYRYGLRDIDGVTNLNLTLALHKSRFVEFTVKPEQAPASAEAAQ
ncbi:MAG TPA: hypothetical protein VMB22_06200 [Verrucomicrobiae bacterium]|nr:hypothetical protein [Verrucomicrobiae bacterium]